MGRRRPDVRDNSEIGVAAQDCYRLAAATKLGYGRARGRGLREAMTWEQRHRQDG